MTILTTEEAQRLTPLFYHKVDGVQADTMEKIREKVVDLGALILRTTPAGRSQSLALTHLEEASMRAIQAVALQGELIIPSDVEVQLPKSDDFRGV
jgi:hypothetical protein